MSFDAWDVDETPKSKSDWVSPEHKKIIAEYDAMERERKNKTRKGRRSLPRKQKFTLGSYKR